MNEDKVLRIKDLVVHYETDTGVVEAVNGVSLDVRRGTTVGLVGETGAGKTTVALAIIRLLQSPPGKIIQGSIEFEGNNLLQLGKYAMRKIRGDKISMIFQDPMTALNPVLTVGEQIAEVIYAHGRVSRKQAALQSLEMLELVGIPGERYKEYPHQFSGGMKQRVVIASSLVCNPELLIADEPTTALDVTIQAQVLAVMHDLQRKFRTSMILITHDMGVVAETCDYVAVVYAGNVVESGPIDRVFHKTSHPYTKGLFLSLPIINKDVDRLSPIEGQAPDPTNLPNYCSFYDRCSYALPQCVLGEPDYVEVSEGHFVRCKLFEEGM